jgi:hypothetical protein
MGLSEAGLLAVRPAPVRLLGGAGNGDGLRVFEC